MIANHVLIHELFLLIINLSQLRDPKRVIALFVESVNSYDLGVHLRKVDSPDQTTGKSQAIETRETSWGYFALEGNQETIDDELLTVLRNAIRMLAILLENLDRARLLEEANGHLEQKVTLRTHELSISNKALSESEERFRQLAENLPDVFWLSSPDWNEVIYVSPAYEKIWGKSCKSLYQDALSWLDNVLEEDRPAIIRTIDEYRQRKRETMEFPEFRVQPPQGAIRWIASKAVPVHNIEGEIYRIAGLAEDITPRKRLEEEHGKLEFQLRQSQKMEAIGRLAGGVAHDFNNMLTAILGYAEYASNLTFQIPEPGLREHLERAINQIRKAGERSTLLTRQLLTFSRQQLSNPEVIDAKWVITDMEEMLRRLIGEHIEIKMDFDRELPAVFVDKCQFEQVIMNLVVNARDAMPSGGLLSLAAGRIDLTDEEVVEMASVTHGRYVRITVSDTGEGMSEETKSRIFDPFFTTKPVDKGTGLGLATVYGIVRQCGGFITVESKLGIGSTFHTHFPISQKKIAERQQFEAEYAPGGHETILLCEDEVMVRSIACGALRKLGYRVLEAANGVEAFEIARQSGETIDLLITDLIMPGRNGHELAKSLLAEFGNLKILYMSGYGEEAFDETNLAPEPYTLLQKPFKLSDLCTCVRSALNGH